MPLEKVPVHLMVPDPEGIVGAERKAGSKWAAFETPKRYRIACGLKSVPPHRTNLVSATTCPGCQKSADYKSVLETQHPDVFARLYLSQENGIPAEPVENPS
jgi:hypothetical protein